MMQIHSIEASRAERLLQRIINGGRRTRNLMSLTAEDLKAVFDSEDIGKEWEAWSAKLS